MNIGEEKETMDEAEKKEMVNTCIVKYMLSARAMAQIMNMDSFSDMIISSADNIVKPCICMKL